MTDNGFPPMPKSAWQVIEQLRAKLAETEAALERYRHCKHQFLSFPLCNECGVSVRTLEAEAALAELVRMLDRSPIEDPLATEFELFKINHGFAERMAQKAPSPEPAPSESDAASLVEDEDRSRPVSRKTPL